MCRLPPIALLLFAPLSLVAAPSGINLGFESGLTGWTSSNVTVETGFSAEGTHRLDLENGFVEQTLTGLTIDEPHWLTIAYLAQDGTGTLADARVLLNGTAVGEFHTAQRFLNVNPYNADNEYITCNGFEFTPTTTTITLRIESLESGSSGLLIDDIRIVLGSRPSPPQESWSNLTVLAGGARQLVNGGFEAAIGSPPADPNNSGPVGNEHLCGYSLPGWLVTRENVDLIQFGNANPPQGTKALDTSGHGPGGIAQTITGLTPGGAYTLSFKYARHTSWGTGDMTGEAYVNGVLRRSLVRTISQTWNDGYATAEIPSIASQSGTLTIEVISTINDLGGCIIYDDFRIAAGAELFNEWATDNNATPDLNANDDHDSFSNGFEFVFGLDPNSSDSPFLPIDESGDQILQMPVAGAALSQGFQLEFMISSNLDQWLPASDENSGVTLLSDTSSKGVDGIRRYLISPVKARLFWQHKLIAP